MVHWTNGPVAWASDFVNPFCGKIGMLMKFLLGHNSKGINMRELSFGSNNNSELPDKEDELRDFLEEVFKLDQSTSDRGNAKECYRRLQSKESEFVGSVIEDAYWNAVSLELFHMAQIAAYDENDDQARDHFLKALDAAKKGSGDEWIAYIEGTIYYLDNNQAGLEQIMNRADGNVHVLQRFLAGLKRRGTPNYKTDY
jgi:hypothetical protein